MRAKHDNKSAKINTIICSQRVVNWLGEPFVVIKLEDLTAASCCAVGHFTGVPLLGGNACD